MLEIEYFTPCREEKFKRIFLSIPERGGKTHSEVVHSFSEGNCSLQLLVATGETEWMTRDCCLAFTASAFLNPEGRNKITANVSKKNKGFSAQSWKNGDLEPSTSEFKISVRLDW
ncbi:hypothetical protein CDAR_9931 [Caerostris darwini]|uniref:Uncharacterized protein n=1 Tax=Caerostris darwini TaxID=1538125 RepID=A0AAV4QY82_9ARAC|nr:hypothetical protein CDAR_9931 [Caerostris darwini]